MKVVEVKDVHKRYGFTHALRGVSLGLDEGLHLIIGPNGSGKSTLLKIIAGIARPSKGVVRVLGRNPFLRRGFISRVLSAHFDDLSVPPWLSGREFVNLWVSMTGCRACAKEVLSVAAEFGVTDYWDRLVATYSSGMKKKVSLLSVLASIQARVIVVDEPFVNLDEDSVNYVVGRLLTLAAGRRAVIVATHIIPEKLSEEARTITRLELGKVAGFTEKEPNELSSSGVN